MQNIFTIDLEEWFHANYHDDVFDSSRNYEVRVIENTYRILKHFEDNCVKATFFVLGYIAEKHRNLIIDIHKAGHEIASHGSSHSLVYEQTQDEFREDVSKSKSLLESIIQTKVLGYRAPSWSITNDSLWALDILKDVGYTYDSSIFPMKTFLYGISGAPRFKHERVTASGQDAINEIPPSTAIFLTKTIGFSGGFYLRAFPWFAIKRFSDMLNKNEHNPVIFYLHPREIDKNQPKLKLSPTEHLIHYFGIKGCEKKLVKILRQYDLTSIQDFYGF